MNEKVYMTMGHYGPDRERVVVNATGYEVVAGLTAEEVRDGLVGKATAALAGLLTATSAAEREVEGHLVDVTVLTWSSGDRFFEFWIEREATDG